jgi:hypothetical protein
MPAQPTIDSLPRSASQSLSRRAGFIWVFQLVFPTIALAHVVIWVLDPWPLGRFGYLVLSCCLVWYGACILTLALRPGRRWIEGHQALFVVLYMLFATSVAVAELTCRATPTIDYDPRLPHITRLSPELGWALHPRAGDIGEHGWRRPAYAHEKSPGHFRIVCIGDSTTFGVNCTWQDAWPRRLEVLLNNDPDWSRSHGVTEVLNLGVLMYGPDQSLLALQNFGLAYSPDLVIFQLSSDDFVDASFDYYWKMNFNHKMYKPCFILKDGKLVQARDRCPPPTDAAGNAVKPETQILPDAQLFLFSFLRVRFQRLLRGEPARKPEALSQAHWPLHDSFTADYHASRPLVWAIINEMSRLSREHGARFVLSLSPHHMPGADDNPPWRVASFRQEFELQAAAVGIPAFDCVPEYFAGGGNDRFQSGSAGNYLNPEGNALIASLTMRWLKNADATAALDAER